MKNFHYVPGLDQKRIKSTRETEGGRKSGILHPLGVQQFVN